MITLASDHAGLVLKKHIANYLQGLGHEISDVGTHDQGSCDYPDFASKACQKVVSGEARCGILICGTGTGMSIVANKIKGIRAALCASELQARMTRAHNDANVLCLGERLMGEDLAKAVVDAFLAADFEGGRHAQRLKKVELIEAGI